MQDLECPTNSLASRVRWQTNIGQVYHLLVFGRVSGANSVGAFDIAIRDFANPFPNHLCTAAASVSGDGAVTFGSTALARTHGNARCGEFGRGGVQNFAPSLWFQITGTGGNMTASTCSDLTTFGTAIQVFTGGACESLSCLQNGGSNTADFTCSIPSVSGLATSVTWPSVVGVNYHILVFGRAPGSSGEFGFSVTDSSLS